MQEEFAVLDRIVDDVHAVLLVGPQEMERVVPRSSLPPGVREGTHLRVQFAGDCMVKAWVDTASTEAAEARIAAKMQALRQRGRPPEA